MRISRFFIDRPIFAAVVSLVFVILGARLLRPAAGRAVPRDRAAGDQRHRPVPRRQRRGGGRHRRRRRSSSRSTASRTCSTSRRTRRATAASRSPSPSSSAPISTSRRCRCRTAWRSRSRGCPSDVRNIGVTVAKASPDLMMVVHLYSPDKSRDTLFISNYASIRVIDVLNRINGVGSISVFGGRDYSMRVWLDPDRLQSLGLTTGDVVDGLAGAERAGRLGRAQPAARRPAARVPGGGADAGPARRSRAVRRHPGQADARLPSCA